MDTVWLETFLQSYGLLAVFLIILLEYACFPLPSEIVLPVSGGFAVSANISFFSVYSISIIAGVLGSLICYVIGRYGGYPLVKKLYKKADNMSPDMMTNFTIFTARLVPIFRTWISFGAGFYKMPMKNFMAYSALGIALWNAALIGGGYFVYNFASALPKNAAIYFYIFLMAMFISVKLITKKYRKKRQSS